MQNELNFKGVEFPVHKKQYAEMEKQNVSINIIDYKNKTPHHSYISIQTFEKHVNSILLSNTKNSHYVKEFNRLMTKKTNYHGKKHFCRSYLQCFFSSKISEPLRENYLVHNHKKIVLIPNEGIYDKFRNFKRLLKASFVNYADFECVLPPSTNNWAQSLVVTD